MLNPPITADGTYILAPFDPDPLKKFGGGGVHAHKATASTVVAVANVDGATITMGEAAEDDGDGFVAYPASPTNFVEPEYIPHGLDTILKVQVSGITSNPVILRWSIQAKL